MEPVRFKALQVEENSDGSYTRQVVERSTVDLPPGDVLVRVHFSSLNYKDALSASGNRGVTKNYPHTPGIDAAGTIVSSSHPDFQPGDRVVAAGSGDHGVSIPGGFGQYVRLQAGWLTRLPEGMTMRESMGYGTAGLTAALCIHRLRSAGVEPGEGPVLVTGATGGVGTTTTAILAKLGYEVVAATGKPDQADFLTSLGAAQVIHRDQVNNTSGKPLLSSRWSGVVDTVGGNYLSTAIRSTRPGGVVTCCGNAASAELPLTVFPFILRGVSLLGADVSHLSQPLRQTLWDRLASDWKIDRLEELTGDVTLVELDREIQKILHGGQVGRVVVRLD